MQETTPVFDLPAIAGGEPAKRTPYGSAPRYGDEELIELREALDQGTLFYAQGGKVNQLEAEFAAKHGAGFAVACSSGTAAIHMACIALGISPGDEVITSPITDIGTVVPLLYQGAVPVFADLAPHGYTLDPESVERCITAKTRAIIAVHLGGFACALSALKSLCDKHDLFLIEDCAQAFGCSYGGQPVGTYGHIGCFSYNEFKHISCGDGGLAITSDASIARRLRLASDKCYDRRPEAPSRQAIFLANNYRMTELQAAVARAQLRKLDGIVALRRTWCAELSRLLNGTPGIKLPQPVSGCEPSWWFYMLRVDSGELGATTNEFTAALQAEGVRCSAHYIGQPVYRYPIFLKHNAFERGGHPYQAHDYARECCPTAETILETCVMLPVNEAFTGEDAEEIAFGIRRLAGWFAREKQRNK